jgi:protein-disulfide isomerase
MDKRFLGILGAIIVIFIIIFAVTQNSNSNPSGNNSSAAGATNHVQGQGSAGVKFVEYGDFECPICEAYYQPLKQAVTPLLPQIYFQFRNLPLTAIHPNAFAAARAAEAAGLQNKFWQMHDKIYENQNAWVNVSNPQSLFATYAQQIGLNVSKFNSDYASSQVNSAVNADIAAFGKTKQQQATPTFFLDGKYVPNSEFADAQTGAPDVSKITQVLQNEINKKKTAASNNTPTASSTPATKSQ